MSFTVDAMRLQAELDSALDAVVRSQERDLGSTWALAWNVVAEELRATITVIASAYPEGDPIPRSTFAKSTRLASLIRYIGQQLDISLGEATARVVRDIQSVVATAAAAQNPIIASMLPSGMHHVMPAEIAPLETIVSRATEQITSQMKPLSRDAYEAVRRELIRGVAVGASPRDVAARMVRNAEGGFNGGLARALNVSRTEMLDAHRRAAETSQNQHTDVLAGWTWLAHLTPTTCRSCIAMNGTLHQLTEAGPIDHQQGRCARVPTTKSWAELGIDIPEPEPVGFPSSDEFFASLTESEQRTILGIKGYAEWKAGRFPMSDWSKTVTNPGWRDSRVPAAAPAA